MYSESNLRNQINLLVLTYTDGIYGTARFGEASSKSEQRDSKGRWVHGTGTYKKPSTTVSYPESYAGSGDTDDSGRYLDSVAKVSAPDTTSETSAFRLYSGLGSNIVNDFLRMGNEPDNIEEGTSAQIRSMDSVMARSPLPDTVVVWRGLITGHGPDMPEEGGAILDKAFQSTTLHRSTAEEFMDGFSTDRGEQMTLLKITVPKGTHAVAMTASRSSMASEREILLDRGTTMKVHKVSSQKISGAGIARVMECTVVPKGNKK